MHQFFVNQREAVFSERKAVQAGVEQIWTSVEIVCADRDEIRSALVDLQLVDEDDENPALTGHVIPGGIDSEDVKRAMEVCRSNGIQVVRR